jgi:pyruvyl transferase EpsO
MNRPDTVLPRASSPTAAPLQATLRSIYEGLIGRGRDCALLDFPDHANVGDSAIWVGQVVVLRSLGARIRYAANHAEFSLAELRRNLPRDGVVLIHGGGNFGTIYPVHQKHRENILETCRDMKVVQLPQTLHYEDDAGLERTAQLVAQHPDFTLLVRDESSFRMGTERLGARTILCPDSALALQGRVKRQRPAVDCLVLARLDKETSGLDLGAEVAKAASGLSVRVADWVEDPPSLRLRLARWSRHRLRRAAYRHAFSNRLMEPAYTMAAWARVLRGIDFLSQGRVVITDRLHGMILCKVAGIPCVALDNNYGKVSGFHRQWLRDAPDCIVTTDAQHAVAIAKEFLDMPGAAIGRVSSTLPAAR